MDETTQRLLDLVDEREAERLAAEKRERESSLDVTHEIARAQQAQAKRLGYRDASTRYDPTGT